VSAKHPATPAQPTPLACWSDRRVAEHGRTICHQRALPAHPAVAAAQAAVLQEWAKRWRQRGPTDPFGQVELGLVEDLAGRLRRLAACGRAQRREGDGHER
jgi:hypothetical protein